MVLGFQNDRSSSNENVGRGQARKRFKLSRIRVAGHEARSLKQRSLCKKSCINLDS